MVLRRSVPSLPRPVLPILPTPLCLCLRLIKKYVTLILEIAWDGACLQSMAQTWGFYSFLK